MAPPTRVSVEDARSVSLLRGQAKTVELEPWDAREVAKDTVGSGHRCDIWVI